jgi:hypothetical protein
VNKADAAASISQSKLAIPSVTVEIAVPALSQDYIQSLPSIGFAIEVPAKEEKDENPPVLPVVTNVTYDKDVGKYKDESF